MIYIIGEKNQRQTLSLLKNALEISKRLEKKAVKLIYAPTDIHSADIDIEENKFISIITNYIRKEKPNYIFLPSTPRFREMAAKITVKTSASLLTDCISFTVENKSLEAVRPSLDGKTLSYYTFSKDVPAIIVVKDTGNAENIPYLIDNTVKTLDFSTDFTSSIIPEEDTKQGKLAGEVIPIKKIIHQTVKRDIKDASLIFAGGRGLMNEESFKELRKLAALFHASIGASRPVVDCGWADLSEQVGQTGSFVHPKIYIAFGISGAIQHLAGMKDSDCIIAINSNPRSPVFHYCNYGIHADANSIIRNMLQILEKDNIKKIP